MNYSTTQATNIASIVGVIMLVLNHYNINITGEELTAIIGGILSVGGVLMNWYNRFQKGDLTPLGFRKY